MDWLCAPLFRRMVLPNDHSDVVRIKKVISLSAFIGGLIGTVLSLGFLFSKAAMSAVLPPVLLAVACWGMLAYFMFTQNVSDQGVDIGLMVALVVFVLADLDSATNSETDRAWPACVLLLDLYLVCKGARGRGASWMLIILVGWLLLSAAESVFRFGLFDLGKTDDDYIQFRMSTVCERPPCKKDVPPVMANVASSVGILLLDFYFTRDFASRVLGEKHKIEASVEAAKQIAHALAAFDLDRAQQSLSETDDLPPALCDAFQQLLLNLTSYRPYLPDALFSDAAQRNSMQRHNAPPGLHSSSAAIVFTDIRSSTVIWNLCPEGMKKALRIHNTVLRTLFRQHNGYEVKTIGDAFMLAFQDAGEAVRFALNAHVVLNQSQWPASILEIPACEKAGELWAGLQLRIGVHVGEVEVEHNPIVDRYDYFGSTVNKAARLERACVAGSVAVSSEVIDAIGDDDEIDSVTISRRTVDLAGIGDTLVTLLLPRLLEGRRQRIEGEVKQEKPAACVNRRKSKEVVSNPLVLPVLKKSAVPPWTRDDTEKKMEHIGSATIARIDVRVTQQTQSRQLQDTLNDALNCIVRNVDRSWGKVITLLGSSLSAGWNTAIRCPSHVDNAFRFVKLVFNEADNTSPSCCFNLRVGLCSGGVNTGTVGADNQKFVTVCGTSVSLCGFLASAAAYVGAPALFSFVGKHSNTWREFGRSACLRPVCSWNVTADPGEAAEEVIVYEVGVHLLQRTADSCVIDSDDRTERGWGWTADYWDAYNIANASLIRSNVGEDTVGHFAANALQLAHRSVYL